MPNIHVTIPTSALPTELAQPNKIVSKYETYTLIPRLGPLTYSRIRTVARRHLLKINDAYQLLENIQIQKNEWEATPSVFVNPADIAFDSNRVITSGVPTVMNTRVINASSAPITILQNLRELSDSEVEVLSLKVSANKPEFDSRLADSNALILNTMKTPNYVIKGLVDSGKLIEKNGDFKMDIANLSPSEKLGEILKSSSVRQAKPSVIETQLADSILEEVSDMKVSDNFKDAVKEQANAMRDWIADMVKSSGMIPSDMQSVDDSVIVDSREWAFLRHERVELVLGQPKFRGPLSVDSVAPNSELFYSSSQSIDNQRMSIDTSERGSRSASSQLVSSKIKEKLGTLYDYGSNLGQTMSEQAYSRDVSKGEKRSMVEATLLEMSEKNASTTISASMASSASMREYRTQGIDTDFATTAVSFEAFVPIEVTHYLDEIGAVWAPRMRNPFIPLFNDIEKFETETQARYIAENYVVDPAEPLPSYEAFESVFANTRKVLEKDYEDTDHIYEAEVTIRLTDAQSEKGYFLDADVSCQFIQDTSDDDFEADQYRVLEPIVIRHIPNQSITIRTRVQILDFPFWDDPDYFYLKVSVTRYKYAAVYLEQLKDYNQTVGLVNVARRAAVQSQAKKYARLKKEELINRYHNDPAELRDYTFISLMKMMFGVSAKGHWSYYHGIIKSCIDWDNAQLNMEPADPAHLKADGLSPYHFLNVNATRFFLPVHKGSEEAFFAAVSNTIDPNWAALFSKVNTYMDTQRSLVETMTERMNAEDEAQLTLDNYQSELVLGRHLEAVLSHTAFLEK